MRVLITSGGTKIPIDDVRHIGNLSNGTFGSKIATEFLKIPQSQVCFLRAERSESPFSMRVDLNKSSSIADDLKYEDMKRFWYETKERYDEVQYKTFDDYYKNFMYLLGDARPDVIILAAAASDYDVENKVKGKLRSKEDLTIKMKPLPKIISKVRKEMPDAVLVGFKLMVDSKGTELIDGAKRSCEENGCDFVVANDLRNIQDGNHIVDLVYKDGRVTRFNPKNGDNPAVIIANEAMRFYAGRK